MGKFYGYCEMCGGEVDSDGASIGIEELTRLREALEDCRDAHKRSSETPKAYRIEDTEEYARLRAIEEAARKAIEGWDSTRAYPPFVVSMETLRSALTPKEE